MTGDTEQLRTCRCLLRDRTDMEAERRRVKIYRSVMSEELRAEDAVYEQRLQICTECDALQNGTCMECGCFVEMRAARRDMNCPLFQW